MLVDVALREAAGHTMTPIDGSTTIVTEPAPADVLRPRARRPAGQAPALGADTDDILGELGMRR
jgi:hypothetical protein